MRKINLETVKEKLKSKHNNKYDYSLFCLYKTNKEFIDIICPEHGVFCQRIDAHSTGQGCPECKKITLSKLKLPKLEIILNKFKLKHNDSYDYSLITEYKGTDESLNILCKKHGLFKQTAHNHLRGAGCPYCYNEKRYTYSVSNLEEFSTKSKLIHGEKYDYSKGVYKNSKTEIEIICPFHGSFFKKPNNHLNGKEGCPLCFSSKGERKIFSILYYNNIDCIRQKTFKGCVYKGLLRFDFYLQKFNMCIEYNGQQHYETVDKWGGIESLEKEIKKDGIKVNYCKINNIKLISIKYDEDVYDRLKSELSMNLVDTEDVYNEYLLFDEAKIVVNNLNIKSQKEYHKKYKSHCLLPSHPHIIYKNVGWNGWLDFLSKTERQIIIRDKNTGRFLKN